MTNLPFSGEFRVTCIYGKKGNLWTSGYHKGIDLVCSNRKIYSTCDGIVRSVGWDQNGLGRYVRIQENIDYVMYLQALYKDIYNYFNGDFANFKNKYYNEYVPNAPSMNGNAVWDEIEGHNEMLGFFKNNSTYQECLNKNIYIEETGLISNLITSFEDDLMMIKEDFYKHIWGLTS